MDRLRVIDAHVHFWDPAVLRYPWLDGLPSLRRSFLPSNYEPLSSGSTDAVLFIEANAEASRNPDEIAFVERLAAVEPRIIGIIAFVDLQGVRSMVESLDCLAQHTSVVGVRQNIQGHPPGFALTANFVRGVDEVGRRGLPFDLCITADQLPEATELVRRCPATRFVLDHCGKPAIRDNAFEPWARGLSELAECANAMCKVSGLLTEMNSEQDIEVVLQPYLDHVLSCFGVNRLMYGSDWPVVTLRASESVWRARLERFTSAWSSDEKQAIFARNAARVYGLSIA
jgi:L-fuconolactonase